MSQQLPSIDWVKDLAYRAGDHIRDNFYEIEKEVGASHECTLATIWQQYGNKMATIWQQSWTK